ncbi:MAG: DUF2189 domain-containing protein [Alphaproteobacteria bacterium]|jgi:uncharacterized membrane protein|nr:DUF2189 domain-containing protein [Alphaproteobacteria bacterium]
MTARSDVEARPVGAGERPAVRRITTAEIVDSLRRGLDDFRAVPTHYLLYGLVYAVAGLILVRAAFDAALLPLMFPLVAGFALIAPTLSVGLFELSRRREQGHEARWWHIFGVRRHAAAGPILVLDLLLALWFVLWLATAAQLYAAVMGPAPSTLGAFLAGILTTPQGWTLMLVGNAVGFVFALVAFAVSAVSFPLLVDTDLGLRGAVATSVRAVVSNPGPMALWAAILAGGLILGSLPLLLGLPVVLPILGHATWHVYRRVVGT